MSQQDKIITLSPLAKLPSGSYMVNEIFYSLQGEGRLAGTPMVFVRFSQCNLRCSVANAGFDCDTEFSSGRQMTLPGIFQELNSLNPEKGWALLTGGEPALQIDQDFVDALHKDGWKIAIETNGTINLPDNLDWICVSPKSAEHTIRQRKANEVKYVRRSGMALPETTVKADNYLISPAFEADGSIKQETLDWCIELVKSQPSKWSLSVQYHKLLGVR